MKSKICSSKYVKTISKGKGWIPAFLTLGFLLAFPVVSLLLIGNWMGSSYTSEQMSLLYANLWKDEFLLTGAAVAVLAAVLNGIDGFIYLYSRKKTDFYHSLPVKRSWMFWNRVYTGLIYYLVPYIVMGFLAICIGAVRGFFSLQLMVSAWILCILHLLLYLMVYFSVVLIFGITGNLLMGTFCLALVYFYGPILGFLLGCYRQCFYGTFYPGQSYGLIRFLGEYASPAGIAEQFYKAYGEGGGKKILFVIFLLTIVFAVCSYIAYLKRPSEAAGQPMVYRLVALIVKFLVVVPCGMAVGYIFYLIPTSNIRIFWWVFGLILGTILAHGIIETAYQMDFHCFFKKKLQFLGTAAVVAICAFVYQTDLFHYDAYIPSQEKLASISMDMNTFSGNMGSYVRKLKDGTYDVQMSSVGWDQLEYTVSDKKGIGDKTYAVFKKIVEKQNERQKYHTEKREPDRDEKLTFSAGIMYRLQSGKKIYRNYQISAEESRELLKCLYEEENLKDSILEFLDLDAKYLTEIYHMSMDGKSYVIFQNQEEKRAELLEALKKDIQKAEADELLGIPCGSLQLSFRLPSPQNVKRLVPGREEMEEYAYGSVNLLPNYKNTLSVLAETGYPLSMEVIPVEKATVVYYDDDNEKTVVYEKEKELRALKEAAVPAIDFYPWLECVSNISVTFQSEQGYEFYVDLLEDRIPDFIKKEMGAVDENENTSIIGGADGPTSIIVEKKRDEELDD